MLRERRNLLVGLAVLVGVLVLAMCAYYRSRRLRQVPTWLNPGMNADGIAGELATLTPAESCAANGCVPMAAPSSAHTARREVMRTYPPSLSESPSSFVGLRFHLGNGC